MSILAGVTTGAKKMGIRCVVGAQEKIGKTTFGCSAPGSLLVPLEQGFTGIVTPKTALLTDFRQVMALTDELIAGAKSGRIAPGSSIVWDSATALERMIDAETIAADPKSRTQKLTMETAHEGYGKAYSYANGLFWQFLSQMDQLATYGGINIILTCHVFAARVIDPSAGEYDQWDLLMHSPKNQKSYGKRELITQWADVIGFLHEPVFVTKAAAGEKINRGFSQNSGLVMEVTRSPSWVAGNRFGVAGPIAIPKENGWNALAHAIYNQTGLDYFNRA